MARIEEVVAVTEKEIAQVRTEKVALENQLYKVRSAHCFDTAVLSWSVCVCCNNPFLSCLRQAQADSVMTEQLQKTFSEQEAILTACNSEIKQLKEHLAIQNGNLHVLQNRSVVVE